MRTLARASASGMSLSASLEKSFSGFNKTSDMMTTVGVRGRLLVDEAGDEKIKVTGSYTAMQKGKAVLRGKTAGDER